jgi:hypothetical protein
MREIIITLLVSIIACVILWIGLYANHTIQIGISILATIQVILGSINFVLISRKNTIK